MRAVTSQIFQTPLGDRPLKPRAFEIHVRGASCSLCRHFGSCCRDFSRRARVLLFGTGSALAIPSPELIVGSFVSLSQLFALASAMLGGGAAYATLRARRAGAQNLSRPLMVVSAVLFALLAGSVGFNIYQYVSHANEQQARLEETLLRPASQPGALPGDPEVKELNYRQQTQHPLGLTTAETDKLLQAAARGERDDLVFLDVREAAERAMGTLPGVTFIRYPDVASSKLNLKGKRAILFCHNGNRSHETCEAMRKMGLDCQFMVGGLEKWVVEGRSMDGLGARTLDQLRAVPDYRNRNTLLDTNEVRRMVADEKAIFVDVRYPVEFKTHGHLPNAINLTVRRIPTAELPKHIAALPDRPIILPCYDRRGCFFAEVLGYELSKAGRDVRGRFTVPWSYFVQTDRPQHVARWIAENDRSLWSKGAIWLAGLMHSVSQWLGVVGAILLLALISRALVMPFSRQGRARPTACPGGGGRARRHQDAAEERSGAPHPCDSQFLSAAWHHTGPKSSRARLPARDGDCAAGGAGAHGAVEDCAVVDA